MRSSRSLRSLGRSVLRGCSRMASPLLRHHPLRTERRLPWRWVPSMSLTARIVLLALATMLCGFVTLLGASVSYGLEPYRFSIRTGLLWLTIGMVVSSPLWIPALISNRFCRTLKFARWLSACVLTLPMCLFGSIISSNIARSINGLGATPSAIMQGLALTTACLVGFVILLWPELKRGMLAFRGGTND